eukprot:1986251-Rhodomonas_salina.1
MCAMRPSAVHVWMAAISLRWCPPRCVSPGASHRRHWSGAAGVPVRSTRAACSASQASPRAAGRLGAATHAAS